MIYFNGEARQVGTFPNDETCIQRRETFKRRKSVWDQKKVVGKLKTKEVLTFF